MVTIFTTRFRIQQFYVLPTERVYVFGTDLKTNNGYLYRINWLVFITKTECDVHRAVHLNTGLFIIP